MTIYYVPFHYPNYENVRLELEEKYKDKFDPAALGSELIEWSQDNFFGLYDYVQLKSAEKNLQVIRSRFFFTPKNSTLVPHTDGHTSGKISNKFWALNFPIIAPKDNHVQQWYDYSGELVENFNLKYTSSYMVKNPELLIPTKRLVLDKPYFVSIGQVHGVSNNSDSSRLILSVRFNSNNIFNL